VTIEGEDAYLAARLVDVPGYGYLDLPDDLRNQLEIEMKQTVLEAQAEEQVGINPIERVSGHMVTMSGTAIGFLMLVELNDQWKALAGSMIGTFLENFGAGPDGESSLVDIAGTNVMVTTTADEVDYAWFNDGVVHLVVGGPSASTTSFIEGFINATAASGVATTTTFG
jgi:hypothetical protein